MNSRVLIAIIVLAIVLVVIVARRTQPSVPTTVASTATNVSSESVRTRQETESHESVASVETGSPSLATKRARIEDFKRETDAERAMWQAPLIYFGKVVDESNQPISGVQVSYGANSANELGEEVYNTGTVTTDERGMFKIDGVRGINLMVQLSHPNYYAYPDNSTGFDKRAIPRKGYFSDNEVNAELFRMHSKGHPVSLVHRRGGADVPVNSGNATVEFDGQQDKQVIGVLEIEASGNTPKNWSASHYDWSVRLTVPGGGLLESTNQFAFVAPDSGYQESIEINMNKSRPDWSDTISKSYFVKLSNGFLRMEIRMRAKTPLYTSLEYFFNPDGSRNLEPAQ